MKSIRQTVVVLISTVLAAVLHSFPAVGGAKSYDLNILLNKPHPFSDKASASPAPIGLRPMPVRITENKKRATETIRSALTLFGGAMTDNKWEDIFRPGKIDFRDTTLLGIAASRRIWDFEETLSMEIEGQVVRYFGDQDNWEFNLPLVVRWHVFPWDKWIDTSFALGIGPSYASEIPREEVTREGSSARWLVYWLAELEFGLPSSLWRGIFRLHHRSGAYGIVADEGGSNSLTVGLRRHY